jgi:hypothetical protein
MGARGGIATLNEIESLIRSGRRRPLAFTQDQLESARLAV